ncbi:MAG: outer membrane lipoprotein carrier protein LolA [Balneolaceae bacterium]|nr:outer membrane lipoprotein carrier protein LolA [Balneolaceae bacterium]
MIWMNMIAKKYSILFLVFGFFVVAQAGYAQDAPFEQLKQKFENGQIFKADFNHKYVDSYTDETVENSGEIWVGENQYKVDSPNQLVAVNGDISRVYDSERNRVIISTYVPEEDDFAPSRILNGIDSTYTIDEQEKKGDNYLIKLSSDDPFALFQNVEITLNSNLIPLKIFVRDPADNLITTTFSDGSFINRRENIFELEYPANAEIIDMRN